MDLTESVNDFNRKYGGCYFKITQPVEGLLKFDNTDGRLVYGILIHPRNNEEVVLPLALVETDFEYPALGVINIQRNVIYGTRVAARQWRRCFYPDPYRVSFRAPLTEGIAGKVVQFRVTAEIMKQVFYPEYFTSKVAWNKISTGKRISAAINPKFYIGVNAYLPFIYLGYKQYYIGKAEKDQYIIDPKAAHLYEELESATSKQVIIGEIK